MTHGSMLQTSSTWPTLDEGLTFAGIRKTTLVDYPGMVACTLFLGGCNFRCGYCHNSALVLNHQTGSSLSEDDAMAFLHARRGFLDGVCVSGGEPLRQAPRVLAFCRRVKALGYRVKVDTNGSFPSALRELIEAGAMDFVAMDSKAPLERYARIAGRPMDPKAIQASVRLLQTAVVDYEFRTTVGSWLTLHDVDAIGRWLAGSRRYVLQRFVSEGPLLDASFAATHHPPSLEELFLMADRLRHFIRHVHVRS